MEKKKQRDRINRDREDTEGEIFCFRKEEREYPGIMKNLEHMPKKLYVKGKLPDSKRKSVAIIGARDCSNYGRKQAYIFARSLAEEGVQIISGMARGVDGSAHRGALEGGGDTFAVMGCGVDICYPKENRDIYERILLQGGIISELAPGTPALPGHFPARNRIISALSDIVLVIEARKKSGSLITVNFALEQGKTVYALPGRLGDTLSEGCNNLIFDGAGIAKSVECIMQELDICETTKKELQAKSKIRLARQEEMVYSCVDFKPRHLDEILSRAGLESMKIREILLELELQGLIEEPVKNYYARTGDTGG